ncbi:MAG TPA: type I DNA topoisomerase [Gemmatimonadaceae bacterium]|nr:type I DNA topoisomerase [Gemmatimonadaceae bacterium]
MAARKSGARSKARTSSTRKKKTTVKRASAPRRKSAPGVSAPGVSSPGVEVATRRRGTRGNGKTAAGNGKKGEPLDMASLAGKALVIVESPAKAKTIGKYLGADYKVRATVGHVRDLPAKGLGIDVAHGFNPTYVTVPGKEKTLAELKSAAKVASHIYLATDPDREGEAIAWHVAETLKQRGGAPMRRVMFHEITRDAVQNAIRHATSIDEKKVEAQQARRVLDRLVGYKASPLLWKTVKKGLSAGRVQTVALRLIVEREREIRAFKAVEYWTVEAHLEKKKQRFIARLHQIDGRKTEIASATQARDILADIVGADIPMGDVSGAGIGSEAANGGLGPIKVSNRTFTVTDVRRRERRKNPSAPFTTSTLQQEAAKKISFGSKKTMRVAQGLYEGVDLGPDGATGLITYMRTDSTRVAESAAQQAREYLTSLFGASFLAAVPQLYGKAQQANAQDAHEAIRPTDPSRRPEHVRRYLSADQFKLYELIWRRFMASQMAPAVFDTTTVDFDLGRYLFRSTGSVVKFEGFLVLYRAAHEDGDGKSLEDEQALPVLEVRDSVPVREIVPLQHFTEPPPRFSEASLVKELERLGIGRPSTYASIISVLAERRYVTLEQRRFTPTPLGETVTKIMVRQFPKVFNVAFTSAMEGELDKIEEGELKWRKVLEDFYGPFSATLEKADIEDLIAQAHDLSMLETERCPKDGGRLVPRGGFFGPYLACENRPACDYTRALGRDKKPAVLTDEICQLCGAKMYIRQSRSGEFLGCSRFPKCRGTRPLPIGVKCPKDGGDLIQLRSKKGGRAFYGCTNHPNCDFVTWHKPVPDTCPECGNVGAEARSTKVRGEYRRCLKCGNEW